MPEVISTGALSELIGSIYDCALAPERWERTLDELRNAFNAQVSLLGLTDLRTNRLLLHRTIGIEPYWLQELHRHMPEINGAVANFGAGLDQDDAFVISRHVPPSYLETSPYYRECLQPQGIADILQHKLVDTQNRHALFGVSKNTKQGLVTEREMELAALLLPHLRRAVMISDVLDIRTIKHARMTETLDALRCGVILTNAQSAILHANAAAERMMAAAHGPIQGHGGLLAARSDEAAVELRAAIRLAAGDNNARLGKAGLAIALGNGEGPPVLAHVLPLNGGDVRTRLQPQAVAAVFIGIPGESEGAETMAAVFGLTPAETRLLSRLLAGRTLEEAAAEFGIAISTAKTHLRAIFAKTGVARQADLVRLGASLVPPSSINESRAQP
jgi:DNA-binding CsgD family transcriptional regulator/PAS domain-containing protein